MFAEEKNKKKNVSTGVTEVEKRKNHGQDQRGLVVESTSGELEGSRILRRTRLSCKSHSTQR